MIHTQLTRDPLESFFRGFFIRSTAFDHHPHNPAPIKMDIAEKSNCFVVHAELAGIKKDDIDIQIEGNVVTLSAGSSYHKTDNKDEKALRKERYCGKYSRTFQLPQDIDDSNADASLQDGVLTLTLPKKAPVNAKRLIIKETQNSSSVA